MFFVFVLSLLLSAPLILSMDVDPSKYIRCGGAGHIEKLTIEPCNKWPCEVTLGSKVKIHFVGSFDRDSNSVRVKPSAIIEKLNITLPGIDSELCGKHVQCPVKANELRDVEIEVPVFKMYPPGLADVAFLVYCEKDLQFCIRAQVLIKDD